MSMIYTILLGSTASTATLDNTLAQKALDAELVHSNMQRWTKELCAVFGDCTVSIVDGNYIMDSGELCIESTFQFTCVAFVQGTDTEQRVMTIVEDMRTVFNQECVLVTRVKCTADLVGLDTE